ncbi:MAG: hypothetical protein HOO06_08590 [Bdellovibrionaceae bacterium]|nr:hypothetical protein [Pseudobdellovibrionaceae bacterium]
MKQLSLLIILTLYSLTSYAQFIKIKKGQWFLNNELSYFKTLGNFEDEFGSFVKLNNNNSFKYSKFSLKGRYDYSNKLALTTELPVVNSESSDSNFSRTNSGVPEVSFGVISKKSLWGFKIYPTAKLNIPLYTIDTNTDKSLLSDGAFFVSGGFKAVLSSSHFVPYFDTGIKYRGEGLSTLIYFDTGATAHLGNFFINTALETYTTVIDDENINTPENRTQVTDGVNGTSLAFYSINPSLIEVGLGLGYKFNKKHQLGFKYKTSIDGKNAPFSDTYFLTYSFRGQRFSKKKIKKMKRSKILKEFQEELDDLGDDIKSSEDI